MFASFFNLIAWLLDNWWVFYALAAGASVTWIVAGGSIRKVVKFFLYTAVFSVLIVMVSTFFPFIGGKDYFFRTAIQLALIFSVLWWAFESRGGEAYAGIKRVAEKPLFIAVSAFALAVLLSSVFAYDPNAAFWSNFERGEGGFQMLHYYVFFALLTLFFDKKEDWLRLFKVSVLVSFLMIAYGVLGNFGLAPRFINTYGGTVPEGLWRPLVSGRFHGSLGNPAYVAPYLIFSLFYLFYLWNESAARTAKKFLIYGSSAVIFLFFFILTQTRAGIVGLGVSVFAFLVYLILSSARKWRKPLAVVLAALILLGGLVIKYQDSRLVQSLPGWQIFSISFSANTLNTRFWTWGSAWKGFLEKPILGWGTENFSAVFDKYFDSRHHVPDKNAETWFDRAHSIYFDYLSETGILGLSAYLSIFLIILWKFVKPMFHFLRPEKIKDSANHGGELAVERALIFAVPVGYLVQGLAIFDVFPMYINLFLFFAFCHYYFYAQQPNQK